MNLRDLVERDIGQLRRANSIEGGEYAGPCPFCGTGDDRFRVWPDRKPKARYFCRVCGRSGDTADYLEQQQGMSRREALAAAGVELRQLPGKAKPPAGEQPIRRTAWPLVNAAGELVATHTRLDWSNGAKTYAWSTPADPKGLGGLAPRDLPLYGMSEVLATAQEVVLVEGEKAADALRERSITAVGVACGVAMNRDGSAVVPGDESLAPLGGRIVALWPDADPQGRALMDGIARRLNAMGTTAKLVQWQEAPPSGDAADYTGPTEQLIALLTSAPVWRDSNKPRADVMGDRAVRVEIGGIGVLAEDLTKANLAIHANVTISIPDDGDRYVTTLDLMSASARQGMARDLRDFYIGAEYKWPRLLDQAAALIRATWLGHNPSLDLAAVTDRKPDEIWRVERLLEEGQPTIFFGDGSNGKSMLMLAVALHVALGLTEFPDGDANGLSVRAGRVLYLDYETDAATLRARARRIMHGIHGEPTDVPPGALTYWNPRGKPLIDVAESVRRELDRDPAYALVIIDSAAFAAGGKPEDSDSATRFFDGLAILEKTAGIVAHVTKAGETEKPFGSVFWHNGPRLTWNVQRTSEADSDRIVLVLYNRKANDTRRMSPIGFELTFDGDNGPISIRRISETDANWPVEQLPLAGRILVALRDGAKTAADLSEELTVAAKTISNNMSDLSKRGKVVKLDNNRWGLAA